jgi:hypothetical protein
MQKRIHNRSTASGELRGAFQPREQHDLNGRLAVIPKKRAAYYY